MGAANISCTCMRNPPPPPLGPFPPLDETAFIASRFQLYITGGVTGATLGHISSGSC